MVDTTKIQVVDGEGHFVSDQVGRFVHDSKLDASKGDYQVVAIMGPQSSGKSTLMNFVFGTNFVMMDALSGRSQTTKGIWLSKSSKVTDRLTLVMDLEGSDGRERGEDDTNFERQIALFALAVADILLVNIWCHDVGREQGSGKPLLRTIFQVNLKLFAPDPNRKRTVLLFVIRDKTKTPLPKLTEVLEDDLNKLWGGIEKPAAYHDSKITDFFDVQYAGMSHFEEKQEDFVVDATVLRRRFSPDGDDSLVRNNDQLPGDAFALSIQTIWETIRQQKDLNLPAHKIMVANIRCAEIARDQLAAFSADAAWMTLQQEGCGLGDGPEPQLVSGFNQRLTSLMDSCIQGYNEDALYFDASVRSEKLTELQAKLRELLAPVVQAQTAALQAQQLAALKKDLLVGLMHNNGTSDAEEAKATCSIPFTTVAASARAAAMSAYKRQFNEHLRLEVKGWEGKEALAAFEAAADSLISSLRTERIRDARNAALKHMNQALAGPITSLLDTCPANMWPRLHNVTRTVADNTLAGLVQTLSGYSLSSDEQTQLQQLVMDAADARLANHAREAAQTRLSRMKDRFTDMFTLDANKAPRIWRPHENIPAIAREARLSSAQLLGQLAVFRPEPPRNQEAQESEGPLPQMSQFQDVQDAVMAMALREVGGGAATPDEEVTPGQLDVMSAASWPHVDEAQVLVQPHEVRTTWREFMASSNALIQQAQATQQANRMAGNRMPPMWAMFAMVVLGWNEAVALIWNPVYLIIVVVLMLFGYSLYQELDVETEMSRGSLPGALSLASKIGPAVQSVLARTWDVFKGFVDNPGERLEHFRQVVSELELPRVDSPRSTCKTTDFNNRGHGSARKYALPADQDLASSTDATDGGSGAFAAVTAVSSGTTVATPGGITNVSGVGLKERRGRLPGTTTNSSGMQ